MSYSSWHPRVYNWSQYDFCVEVIFNLYEKRLPTVKNYFFYRIDTTSFLKSKHFLGRKGKNPTQNCAIGLTNQENHYTLKFHHFSSKIKISAISLFFTALKGKIWRNNNFILGCPTFKNSHSIPFRQNIIITNN